MNDIAAEIAALDQMVTGDLAERYAELHGQPCRTRHRVSLPKTASGPEMSAELDVRQQGMTLASARMCLVGGPDRAHPPICADG